VNGSAFARLRSLMRRYGDGLKTIDTIFGVFRIHKSKLFGGWGATVLTHSRVGQVLPAGAAVSTDP